MHKTLPASLALGFALLTVPFCAHATDWREYDSDKVGLRAAFGTWQSSWANECYGSDHPPRYYVDDPTKAGMAGPTVVHRFYNKDHNLIRVELQWTTDSLGYPRPAIMEFFKSQDDCAEYVNQIQHQNDDLN
jgi:hypothetical protein